MGLSWGIHPQVFWPRPDRTACRETWMRDVSLASQVSGVEASALPSSSLEPTPSFR